MTITHSPSEQIVAEVTSWPGMTARHGSRGELSLRALDVPGKQVMDVRLILLTLLDE